MDAANRAIERVIDLLGTLTEGFGVQEGVKVIVFNDRVYDAIATLFMNARHRNNEFVYLADCLDFYAPSGKVTFQREHPYSTAPGSTDGSPAKDRPLKLVSPLPLQLVPGKDPPEGT
jgi:hypothetical protein